MRNWPRVTISLGLALLAMAALTGCNIREYAMFKAVAEQPRYVPDVEHRSGWDIKKITDRVYTFRWTWDRSIVVLTDEGFVVTDPFNREAATILKGALEKIAPGRPVHTMFYSHYHLDHVVGGEVLKPQRVIAHAKCPEYWADLTDSAASKDILKPTQLIEGDQHLTIGGVAFELLYLGRTHTDTLYAFYLPGEKVLHTVDLGIIRTFFPLGGPDMYFPGILKQMERLAQLDFDAYVPSHFGYGTKRDFLEAFELQKTIRRLSVETAEKYGLPETGDAFVKAFRYVYDPLKAKYGGYHGFNEQILFVVARGFSGAFLGY